MKFKDGAIKVGRVIHCPTEEDARALLKYLFVSGYDVHQTDAKHSYFRIEPNKFAAPCLGGFYSDEITEFSDLLEPEMRAVEVLEWLKDFVSTEDKADAFEKLFEKYGYEYGECAETGD